MAVLQSGAVGAREAVTHYRVLGRYGQISYLSLRLETGRTHQIRVHMSHRGHPLLGDEVYGRGASEFEKRHKALFQGQALHAVALELTHPRTNEKMRFECELPDEFKKLLDILEKTV
jgi:23S rRNA pseudouridine1911/1915/1917 synthase